MEGQVPFIRPSARCQVPIRALRPNSKSELRAPPSGH